MALPPNINDREFKKFEETDQGEVAVRVSGSNFSGTFKLSGLNIGGRFSQVTVDNLTWTPVPAVALANRNAMRIQNRSGQEIKLNYDVTEPGYLGMVLPNLAEIAYDIQPNVVLYAKSATSSCILNVEEIA
jgi:hypothetical protein